MAGVKVFGALPRKVGTSEQAFHDHWRHPHATWGLSMSGRTHYVQSHRTQTSLLGSEQERFDGVAEIWFDTLVDAGAFNQDPVYQNKLAPDEPSFIDMANLRFLIADEEVLMAGPHRHAESHEDDLGWREHERPVTTKLIQMFDNADVDWASEEDLALGLSIGAFRHVRSRPNPIVHAKGAFISGIRELWWPTLSALERGVAANSGAWERLTKRQGLISLVAIAERYL